MAALAPPDPPLTDGVVTLRSWRNSDAASITRLFQDDDALRWTRAPSPYREGDAFQWLASLPTQMRRGDALPLAVTDAADGSLLASIDLRMRGEGRAEFGYVVGAWARRRSVGTRALRLYASWALETLGVARLELLVQPGNEASLALGRRVGFTEEGLLRSHSLVRGERKDMVMMSLLPGELPDDGQESPDAGQESRDDGQESPGGG
jgi:RimJ/RimL family protein N-acetyltransferase